MTPNDIHKFNVEKLAAFEAAQASALPPFGMQLGQAKSWMTMSFWSWNPWRNGDPMGSHMLHVWDILRRSHIFPVARINTCWRASPVFFLRRSWVDEWELGNSFLRESPCPDRQVVGQPIFGAIVGDSQDWESWVVETWWMQEMSFVWVSDFMFASCLYLVRHGERWRVKQIWFPDFFWLKTNTFAVYIENTFSPSWDECNSISTSASAV